MKRIIGVIFILLCLIPFKIFAASKVKVYVFEAGGCPFCEDQKEYLKKLCWTQNDERTNRFYNAIYELKYLADQQNETDKMRIK